MRIAYFSPLNPVPSGISDYSEEILPYLARYAEVDLFVDGYRPTNPEILDRFPIYNAAEFEQLRESRRYDIPLYHLGNSPFHVDAYRALREHPGAIVLHDFALHHLIVSSTAARGDERAYLREMAYAHGRDGVDAARLALGANHQFPYETYPLNRRILDLSLGVIVHSVHARDLVLRSGTVAPVEVIRHHATLPGSDDQRQPTRARLGLAPEQIVFGSFGLVTAPKRLNVALRAFGRVREVLPAARYLAVGEIAPEADPRPLARDLQLDPSVIFTGRVSKEELLACVQAVDVGINLRWPTAGETSGSLIRLLAAGKPTIVTAVGPFAEFPDGCCPKVPVGPDEEDRLAEMMLHLAADPEARRAMAEAARRYVQENHAIDECARRYVAFLERLLSPTVSTKLAPGCPSVCYTP